MSSLAHPTDIRAAGGLVCRPTSDGWEVAIVGSGEPVEWRLPKGICEEGETTDVTARREVVEETGIADSLGPELGSPVWTYEHDGKPFRKTTTFFLMFYESGQLVDHDQEYREAAWVPISETMYLLRFDSEKEIARRAAEVLADYRIGNSGLR